MAKVIHKYVRTTKIDAQFYMCTGKRCTFAEDISWFWKNVTCKHCLAMHKGKRGKK